jgi:hypothetical protein
MAIGAFSANPDAPLFEILHERELLLTRLETAVSLSDQEGDTLTARIGALEEALMRYRITTPAGLAAYAEVAREMMATHCGGNSAYHCDRVVLTFFDRVEDFAVAAAA